MHAQPGAPQGAETTVVQPSTEPVGKKSNPWIFGSLGLVAGIVVGLTVGFSSNGGGDEVAADTAVETITAAVDSCGVADSKSITVMDGGRSIELQTAGKKTWVGASFSDVTCVLDALQAPESVKARMESTRALDGRQQGAWPGFTVSWGYHPDNGMNVVVEGQETP